VAKNRQATGQSPHVREHLRTVLSIHTVSYVEVQLRTYSTDPGNADCAYKEGVELFTGEAGPWASRHLTISTHYEDHYETTSNTEGGAEGMKYNPLLH